MIVIKFYIKITLSPYPGVNVNALLVAEPITVLQDIVDSLVHPSKKELMTEYLTAATLFLKYKYSQHATMTTDDCVSHDLICVSGRDSKFDPTVGTKQKICFTCNQYRFPYYACHQIRSLTKQYTMSNQSNDTELNTETSFDVLAKIKNATMVIDECEQN